MKNIWLLAIIPIVCSGFGIAQDAETIDHVTNDNVIVLQNGQAYQSEDSTSLTWLPNDDVLILDDGRIVDKDQNETVDANPTDVPDDDAENSDDDSDPEL